MVLRFFMATEVDGLADEFSGAAQAELAADTEAMGFHGFVTESETLADFLIGEARAKQAEDFEFPVAEAAEGTGGASETAALFEEAVGGFRAECHAPAEDAAEAFDEGFRAGIFVAESAGSGFEGTSGVEGFVMHGEDKHGNVGPAGFDVLGEFESVAARHTDVTDNGIRLELLYGIESGSGLFCDAADGEVGSAAQPESDAVADDGVVVHEENAVPGFSRRSGGPGGFLHSREHGTGRGGFLSAKC